MDGSKLHLYTRYLGWQAVCLPSCIFHAQVLQGHGPLTDATAESLLRPGLNGDLDIDRSKCGFNGELDRQEWGFLMVI